MHFSNIFEDDEKYITIEKNLDNNILMYKQKLDENEHYLIKLKENQNAILFQKGQIFDIIKEEGIYTISFAENLNSKDLSDYKIKDNNDKLCVIFFNMNIIEGNKFFIKKKHKNDFYGEGEFNLIVENPIKLFNKVIEVRTFYSREELLEQIRERIAKNIILAIKENIIDEVQMKFRINIFEDYGIKIESCNIDGIKFE